MKKLIISSLLLLLLAMSQTASARGVIPIGTTERLKVVHDFPETEDYMSNPGRYMDVGILYETFDAFWMPLWVTEDPIIVGIENQNTEEYFDFDPEFTQELLTSHELIEEDLLHISFWDKHMGLIVLGGLLIAYLAFSYFTYEEEDEEENSIEEKDRSVHIEKNDTPTT